MFFWGGLALIFLALPSNAGFKRLIRDGDENYLPKNNISACKKEIQPTIQHLLTKEPILFDCPYGIIERLCVPTTSQINTDWKSFITNYPTLFGIKKDEFRFHETNNQLNLTQTWRGVDIWPTHITWDNLSEKKLVCMRPTTRDASGWNLDVKPYISSTTVAADVLNQCETSLCRETPPYTGVTWSTFVEQLTTKKPHPSCEITGVVLEISQQSISSIPYLIWKVSGSRRCRNRRYDISCEIDAHTGLPAFGPCRF